MYFSHRNHDKKLWETEVNWGAHKWLGACVGVLWQYTPPSCFFVSYTLVVGTFSYELCNLHTHVVCVPGSTMAIDQILHHPIGGVKYVLTFLLPAKEQANLQKWY